jgi:hypothetical protein
MKNIFIIFFLVLSVGSLFSQTSVAVVADSPATIIAQINQFISSVRMIEEAVNQVKNTYDVLQAQLKAIESLSQGNLDGISQAISYEEQSISNFNHLINGFDYLKQIDDLDKLLDSPDFNVFKANVSCLDDSMQASGEFLKSSVSLIKNSQKRIEAQKNIQTLSGETQSITGQLQLQQESLSLLAGELEDVITSSAALNNSVLTQQKNDEVKSKLQKRIADQIKFSTDTSVFKSKVSDSDYNDALFNWSEK